MIVINFACVLIHERIYLQLKYVLTNDKKKERKNDKIKSHVLITLLIKFHNFTYDLRKILLISIIESFFLLTFKYCVLFDVHFFLFLILKTLDKIWNRVCDTKFTSYNYQCT